LHVAPKDIVKVGARFASTVPKGTVQAMVAALAITGLITALLAMTLVPKTEIVADGKIVTVPVLPVVK
jgi:hypothetical protein